MKTKDILHAFSGGKDTAAVIVVGLRLPRVLAAAAAGAALAVAGLILQAVTNNDLCAPNIIGVNAGAGFAVILLLSLFPAAWRLLPAAAFVGALATSFIVLAVASAAPSHGGRATLVLAGVAVASILNAGISFLSLRFPDVMSSYTAFSVGGFSGVGLEDISVPAAIIAVCLVAAMMLSRRMNLFCLGDEIASSLGVKVKVLRAAALVIAAALCAAAVSFAGLLGFVGLVVPHIVRRLIGADLRADIPLCALLGAALTIVSDLIGRVAFAPTELPAGIVMAAVGAPFFLWLLVRRRGER